MLLAVTMLVGIVMQTIAGYYRYELLQYFKELYIVTFPQVMAFAFFALFVQTMVSNKFVGHGIVIGVFVLQPILFNFGWENTLYLPGADSSVHLFGHERLRTLRAGALLVDHILAGDLRVPRRWCRLPTRAAAPTIPSLRAPASPAPRAAAWLPLPRCCCCAPWAPASGTSTTLTC